jgi:hypothetical protein
MVLTTSLMHLDVAAITALRERIVLLTSSILGFPAVQIITHTRGSTDPYLSFVLFERSLA